MCAYQDLAKQEETLEGLRQRHLEGYDISLNQITMLKGKKRQILKDYIACFFTNLWH